jgi:GTP cyclohydrolase I
MAPAEPLRATSNAFGSHADSFESNIRELLLLIGEDPERDGLKETPRRVRDAWREWCQGYEIDVKSIFKMFDHELDSRSAPADEIVMIHNIPVYSLCEHHLVPFFGLAHLSYIPHRQVVGLSKMARVVDAFARRLQVQERLTNQIADALWENLEPQGVGVVLSCRHLCMEARGVRSRGSVTTTRSFRGCFVGKTRVRAEFLNSLPE